MSRSEKGQTIVLAAVSLAAFLFLLTAMIEICRLLVIQEELTRAAEAAGKAGLIVVGDQIVTQTSAAGDDLISLENMMTAPPLQTQVAAEVLNSLSNNAYHLDDHDHIQIQIEYPYKSQKDGFTIYVRIEKKVISLFSDVLFIKDGVLSGQSIQTIPQR